MSRERSVRDEAKGGGSGTRPLVGKSQAQFNVGVVYARGLGVAKDEAEAVKWYRKAADQGHPRAQRILRDNQ